MFYLDTNICAFILNGRHPHLTERFLSCSPSSVKIPAIVLYELYFGAEKSQKREENLRKIQAFIAEIEVVPFCRTAAPVCAKIRADLESMGQPIGGNDLLIAATVMAAGGVLITNNMREFARVSDLHIEDWS